MRELLSVAQDQKLWQDLAAPSLRNISGHFPRDSISSSSLDYLALEQLYECFPEPRTALGQAFLMMQLTNPQTDRNAIFARREAIEHLEQNPEELEHLRRWVDKVQSRTLEGVNGTNIISNYIGTTRKQQKMDRLLLRFIRMFADPEFMARTFCDQMKDIFRGGTKIQTSNGYVADLLQQVAAGGQSALGKQVKRRLFPVNHRLDPHQTPQVPLHIFWARTFFNPGQLLTNLFASSLTGLFLGVGYMHGTRAEILQREIANGNPLILFPMILSMVVPIGYRAAHDYVLYRSVPKAIQQAKPFLDSLNAFAEVDAIISMVDFNKKYRDVTCTPNIRDADQYYARYTDMRSPHLYKEIGGASIANDVAVLPGKGILLTGPNSGGKTTLCNALTANQSLAQLSTRVFAQSAEVTCADKILYLGPSFAVHRKHGRFGSELQDALNVFEAATPRSLVIYDEIGGGTREREAAEPCGNIIKAMLSINAGVIVITHNASLIDRLENTMHAIQPKMSADGYSSLFTMIQGVSPTSGAHIIAKDVGVTEENLAAIRARKF